MLNTQNDSAILNAVPSLVWSARADGAIDYVNKRWTDYTGLPLEQGLSWHWMGVVHPNDVDRVRDVWEAAIAGTVPLEVQLRFRRADGVYRWHVARAIPVAQPDGSFRWIGFTFDIDRHKRIERMLELLAGAHGVLAESLDLQTTLERISDLPVPEIADWSAVFLHAETEKGPVASRALSNVRAEEARTRALRVVRTGAPSIDRRIAAFPLTADGTMVGVLAFGIEDSGRSLKSFDVQFGTLLAQRAATALLNAARFERERRAAHILQHALLPVALPRLAGFRLETCYLAAESELNVGGDWYDVFRLDDKRVLIGIGDVAGTSLAAAATMGRVRDALRTAALCLDDPAGILAVADEVLRDDPSVFVTSFAGILDIETRVLRYACAGHYPPRVRFADGTTQELRGRGLPLGVRWASQEARPNGSVHLEPGSLLVLFTDGMIEQRRDIFGALGRLETIMRDLQPEGSALALRDEFVPSPSTDDVAILTIYSE
ncbi:MAG: SpoIIE family protein phosphatase [Candidatus Eremiobacteraeota bacterium]|nr:SpoIIE family protein phosphatase [Candidatus Eremiobacteraeota bacterium]